MSKIASKKLKLYLIWPAAMILLLIVGVGIVAYAIFYFDFVRRKVIAMEYLESAPQRMEIPVRYKDRWLTNYPGIPIYTKDNWRYTLRKGDSSDDMWITICRVGLEGLTVYNARYEITDPEVQHKLRQLWNARQKKLLSDGKTD